MFFISHLEYLKSAQYHIYVIRKQCLTFDEVVANAGRTDMDGEAGALILALILSDEANLHAPCL
jgi:hypothetical protein